MNECAKIETGREQRRLLFFCTAEVEDDLNQNKRKSYFIMQGEFVYELLLLFHFSKKRTEKRLFIGRSNIFPFRRQLNLSKCSEPNNLKMVMLMVVN